MAVLYVRIPDDRMGAAIGPGGRTKHEIEARTGTQIDIDAEEGAIRVSIPDELDPVAAMKARDILLAVGRGFSPERARRLLRDDTYLAIVDIKRVSRQRSKAGLWRVRSRLIGAGGRARERIEELSGCSVSVYGSTVALIGQENQLERATRAIELLLRGSEHATVFHMLARQRLDDARVAALGSPDDEAPPE
ncbi:MAG: KH domain-containing protein [Thermoplasmata archaeon]|nr:KH domain-containing protein [Thermoplasmata archaeon]